MNTDHVHFQILPSLPLHLSDPSPTKEGQEGEEKVEEKEEGEEEEEEEEAEEEGEEKEENTHWSVVKLSVGSPLKKTASFPT